MARIADDRLYELAAAQVSFHFGTDFHLEVVESVRRTIFSSL